MKNVYEDGESGIPAHYVQKWLGNRWCWVPPITTPAAEPSSAPPIIAPTQGAPAQTAWAGTQPPKEPRDAQMLRLRSDLLACVTLAGDLLEPAPRRVVAWRFVRDDGHGLAWSDGDYPRDGAPTSKQWRIERAYSE